MQLFSRRVQMANAPLAEIMAYSTDMQAFVTGQIGRDVGLWSTTFGAPAGTMSYTVRVEGIAELQQLTAKLMENEEYHAKLAKGIHMIGAPAEDMLMTPIHGELGDPPPVGSIASVTSAQIANGAYADAFAWGVEMAMHAESVTGLPTMFLTSQYGPFGTVGWISGAADAAAVDAGAAAIQADGSYMDKLKAARELFVEGSGQQMLLGRIA